MAGFYLARLAEYPRPVEGVGRSLMPQVAAAASWLESLKMPLREMYGKYTKSELGIMAWRSGEISSNMHKDHAGSQTGAAGSSPAPAGYVSAKELEVEERLGSLASKLDEDLDMRKLTGQEVRVFLGAQGLHVPVGFARL